MGSIFKFLQSLTRLASKGDIKIDDAYKFAKQEFGEVSDLLKLQINKIFKQSKAPSIKNPEKKPGEVIEASFKPGMDKRGKTVQESPSQASGIMKTDEASPLMKKMENVVDTLQKNPKRTGGGLDPATGITRTLARRILDKKGIEIGKKDPINVFTDTFGESISDVNNLAEEMLEIDRRGGGMKDIDQMLEKDGLFDIKIPTNPQKGLSDDELIDLMKRVDEEERLQVLDDFDPTFRKPNAMGGINRMNYGIGSLPKGIQALVKTINKKFGKDAVKTADEIDRPKNVQAFDDFEARNPDPKRQMTSDELEDFEMEIGGDNLEAYSFDGTVGDAKRILQEEKQYIDDMFMEYKKGNLDPVAGDKSLARKRFLEKKLDEAEMSGDRRLITQDEVEELSSFDLGTEMDNAKLSVNDEIKKSVDEIMSDTSPAALQKSIEIDNLMLEYPGMSRDLAKQIANDPDPQRKAQVISMVEQTFKMSEKGMSGDEIIDTFKKGTDRTKQANGGLSYLMGM